GVGGVVAAGRVWQQRVTRQIEIIEDVLALTIVQSLATDGDGDAVSTGQAQRLLHRLERIVFAGADDQSAHERVRADAERCVGESVGRRNRGHRTDFIRRQALAPAPRYPPPAYPPPTRETISSRSPSANR